MPIYEYRCQSCGAEFEHLTLSSTDDDVCCQECAGRRVIRLLSAFAVHAAEPAPLETGPCGACGAPRRGMCDAE